jgi:hypothetical protein
MYIAPSFVPARTTLKNNRYRLAGGNPVHCYGIGKVESALHSAFFPGAAPFQHGGIAT